MPRKRKANIALVQNLQGGGDTTSSCQWEQSQTQSLSRQPEMASDDDHDAVCLKSNKSCIDFDIIWNNTKDGV
jgi:hypothetical protein